MKGTTYSFRTIIIKNRHTSRSKISHEQRSNNASPNPPSRSQSIATSHQNIAFVVDMSSQPIQTSCVRFPSILRIILKFLALDLRSSLESHAKEVGECS